MYYPTLDVSFVDLLALRSFVAKPDPAYFVAQEAYRRRTSGMRLAESSRKVHCAFAVATAGLSTKGLGQVYSHAYVNIRET